jgi:hypothetical protein
LCKNICSGVPNGKGFLRIGRNKSSQTIDMKEFKNIKTNSVTYTNTIYSHLEPKYDEIMERMHFESLTLEDRMMYLYSEIQELKRTKTNITSTLAQKGSYFNLF